MQTIHFIKIAAYDTGKNRTDSYTYAYNLLRLELDPPSDAPHTLHCDKATHILSSPLLRAKQSIPEKFIEISTFLDSLREIPFDLTKFVTEVEYIEKGSTAVRTAFATAFCADELNISLANLKKEVEQLLEQAVELAETENVYIVSHSFRMKLLEAYIKSQGQIFAKPELIYGYLSLAQKTYESGAGFEVSLKDIKFAFKNH